MDSPAFSEENIDAPDLSGESLSLSSVYTTLTISLVDVSKSAKLPLLQGSAATVISAHAVSDYERTSYYSGITDDCKHPDLLYRTGSAKYPWIQPSGRHAYQPTKPLRGVYSTPLNGVWSTVGPQDGEDVLAPVVIWVAVYPGSTSADTAHEVSQDILGLLEKNGITDVEVEWHEAVSWKAAGPPLLPVVGTTNPTAHVRRHLTAALGMPIATAEMENDDSQTEGSVGFSFHEGRDKGGNPSTKVFGVSNRHVLRGNIEGTYESKGAGAPRQYVRLNGFHRFQRGLDDTKVSIGNHRMLADLYARGVIKLGAKGTSEDQEETEENARELRITRAKLDEQIEAIAVLEKFYDDVKTEWSDIELRNIGHVHYSPPISVVGKGYTEDWGTFQLDEVKFRARFKGNVVDLGTAIAPEKLTAMMYPQSDGRTTFKYPENRQLRISGFVTRELLANPDLYDSEGQPCLIVLKDGCATDLTIGRYAGLESFLCDEDGVESTELAIYNYDKGAGAFSAKGDSGSLIFNGLGPSGKQKKVLECISSPSHSKSLQKHSR